MNISHIDMRQLRYFIAVAEELSFTRAAQRLNMAQPPLSHQIRELEISLNAQLFHRTKRVVTLTEAGHYLLSAATRLTGDMRDILAHTQAASRGEVGELRIGINFSAPLYPQFPRLITRYRRCYPQVRMIFKEMFYENGIQALYNSDIDICFTRFNEGGKNHKIHFQPFADDLLEICMPKDHPLAAKKNIKMADLKNDLFLLSPRQTRTPLFDALQKLSHKAGFMMRLSQDTAHFPIMINLVAAGFGIAFLPPFMKAMAAGDVVFKKMPELKPAACAQPLMLAFCRANESILLKNFLDLAPAK